MITEVKRRGLTLLETLLSSFLVVGVIGAVTIGLSYYFTHSLKVEQRQTANDILAVNDVQLRENHAMPPLRSALAAIACSGNFGQTAVRRTSAPRRAWSASSGRLQSI